MNYTVATTWLILAALAIACIAARGNKRPSTLPGSLAEPEGTTEEWRALMAAVEPPPLPQRFAEERRASLRAHPSAKRVLDLIAENEAARLDAEWIEWQKEIGA